MVRFKTVKSLAEENLCLVHITALQETWTHTRVSQLAFFSGLSKVFPAWPFWPSKMMPSKTTFFRRFLSIHTENLMEAWSQLILSTLIVKWQHRVWKKLYLHTLFRGQKDMALGRKAVLYLLLCLDHWLGAGNVAGCVQAFSFLYSALNSSGRRLSTSWKCWSSEPRTQQEKAQIQHSAGNVLSIE